MEILHTDSIRTLNQSPFKKGDKVKFLGASADQALLVVGENDNFLHTFSMISGGYVGLNKSPGLSMLDQIEKI